MGKKIIIVCKRNGSVHIEADGYQGVGCEDAIKALMSGAGLDGSIEHKAEYYAESVPPRKAYVDVGNGEK